MKKLLIKNPIISKDNSQYRIEFPIVSDKTMQTLWYAVDEEFEDFVCIDTADGIITTLLPYAIRGGYDIESELPISQKLYYNLTSQLIPQLTLCTKNSYNTKILADCVKKKFQSNAVATAISCGVDSFTTIYEYSSGNCLDDYKLTHLTYFQNGAHHGGKSGYSDIQTKLFEGQLKTAKEFCKENNFKLIVVRSNLDEFLSTFFWKDPFYCTHTYRNIGFAMLLQNGIRTYFYSSAHNISEFNCSLNIDSAEYERFLLPYLSTETFTAYNSNSAMNRNEKIQFISKFPATYKHLTVCYTGSENCGRCTKCLRTLLALDVLGVLDKYSDSFDTEYYKNNRNWYITRLCAGRYDDDLLQEIYDYAKNTNFEIPTKCKLKGVVLFFARKLKNKKV